MIYDITPVICENYSVWPGGQPIEREICSEIRLGAVVTCSNMKATVHLGAHADAPSHYIENGETIEQRDLSYYLGTCQVIRVNVDRGGKISFKDIREPILAERVLFATDSFIPGEPPENGFAAFSPQLINELHHKGVITIGIDTPSIDVFESKQLECHAVCANNDMAIIENLDLSQVPAGLYELIALPLKLKGFDASPVRAILRTLMH